MFKSAQKHVVIGKSGKSSVIGTVLLPNGQRALLLDREVYASALKAADKKFSKIVDQMKVPGGRSKRKSVAA